jgi:small nuclear ribonucleoprotein (snRNP)-like protein
MKEQHLLKRERTMTSAVDRIRQCLNRHVKVDLDDGRVVFGRFRCTDQQNNLVLTESVEQRTVRDVGDKELSVLFRTNLVLIPAAHVVRFCVDHVHDGSIDVTAPPRIAVSVPPAAAATNPTSA